MHYITRYLLLAEKGWVYMNMEDEKSGMYFDTPEDAAAYAARHKLEHWHIEAYVIEVPEGY